MLSLQGSTVLLCGLCMECRQGGMSMVRARPGTWTLTGACRTQTPAAAARSATGRSPDSRALLPAKSANLIPPNWFQSCLLRSCYFVPACARAAPLDGMVWEPVPLMWVGCCAFGHMVLHLLTLLVAQRTSR